MNSPTETDRTPPKIDAPDSLAVRGCPGVVSAWEAAEAFGTRWAPHHGLLDRESHRHGRLASRTPGERETLF